MLVGLGYYLIQQTSLKSSLVLCFASCCSSGKLIGFQESMDILIGSFIKKHLSIYFPTNILNRYSFKYKYENVKVIKSPIVKG